MKTRFYGDYQLRSAHATKHVWVAVINKKGLLHFPPPLALTIQLHFTDSDKLKVVTFTCRVELQEAACARNFLRFRFD